MDDARRLPCINRYHENTTERVELWCYDKGVKLRTGHGLHRLRDAHREGEGGLGIAPNAFIRTVTQAHLLLTVAPRDEGIIDIATVHDSFGCLPSQGHPLQPDHQGAIPEDVHRPRRAR
jgi:DNA-directed RNA polymerase